MKKIVISFLSVLMLMQIISVSVYAQTPMTGDFTALWGQPVVVGTTTSTGTPITISQCWPNRAAASTRTYDLDGISMTFNSFVNMGWNDAAFYFLKEQGTYPGAGYGFAVLYTQTNGTVQIVRNKPEGGYSVDYLYSPAGQTSLVLKFDKKLNGDWTITANGTSLDVSASYFSDLDTTKSFIALSTWVSNTGVSMGYNVADIYEKSALPADFDIVNEQNPYLKIAPKTITGSKVSILSCWPNRAVVSKNKYNLNDISIKINDFNNLGWNQVAFYFLNVKDTYPGAGYGFAVLYTQTNGTVQIIRFKPEGGWTEDYLYSPGYQTSFDLKFNKKLNGDWTVTANGTSLDISASYFSDLDPARAYVSFGSWVSDADTSIGYNIATLTQKQSISFASYNVSQTNYITKITADRRTVNNFKSALTLGEDASLKFTKGITEISGTEKIGTGTMLEVTTNSGISNYTAMVYGDVNGDGDILVGDLASIKLHILQNTPLSGDYLKAADVSKNGTLTISDLLAVKLQVLNIQNINQN